MTKALFKKQMMEVFSWIYRDRKSGNNRSKKGIVSYGLLNLLILVFLGSIFYFVADTLCEPLVSAELGWLFFAIMGLISVALGVFGSVFSTYASLYQAKDNDLLLSMPVPSSKILMVRLSGVYAMGLIYELVVMFPTLIVYFTSAQVGILGFIFTLLIPLVLSVFVLTLSCVLGWVVALVSGRLKNKNIVTVVLSLAFIAAYYYLYMRAYSMLQSILAAPQAFGNSVKSFLYPLYHMGLAAQGNILSMLVFTAMVAALFGVVYLVLSLSFLKLATMSRGAAKVKYREKAARAGSVGSALLVKEARRFLGSPTYMLNCGLGIVIMVIAAAVLLIKRGAVSELIDGLFAGNEELICPITAAAICLMTCMNDISAPSVSLEGKNLWLVQSLPVSGWQALKAKLNLHLVLTLVPTLILTVCVEIVIRPSPAFALLIPVVSVLFVLLMGLIGLFLNLKAPNLNWTAEVVPIKQSMSVMLTLFGGWALVLAFGGLYFAVRRFLDPLVYLVCVSVLLLAASAFLLRWLKNKGAVIFEML